MRAEELMLGDYIRLTNDECVPENLRGKAVMVAGLRDDDGAIRAYTEIDIENSLTTYWSDDEGDFEPIPLTPEILEKNGFKSWEHGYIWKERIGMSGQTTSATSPIEIIIYEGGHSVIMNPHDGREFQGSIDNVHELQHALRVLEIKQEIEL